jgi:raffinose/stachyose/melibiose transport system permease protein
MATITVPKARPEKLKPAPARSAYVKRSYPLWFYLVPAVIYLIFFVVPTLASFFFSFTRWNLTTFTWIGGANYLQFLEEPALVQGLQHTVIYAFVTSAAKVVIGLFLAIMLTGPILGRNILRSVAFFPVLVSTIGVGITFTVLMNPETGLFNQLLATIGVQGPGWLTDPRYALLSVAAVDVWKGVGMATVIYMAGIVSIPSEYYEAAKVDGATSWERFRYIILPLSMPATANVIILSLIGGLRSFDLIWAMTKGGPGFTSDVIASVIYKQYSAGFYGLSTAGNVVLFLLVALIAVPLNWFLNRNEADR